MNAASLVRLVLLAAIWGGSFVLVRIISPMLGPVLTADLRILIAGLVLVVFLSLRGFGLQWSKYWKNYLVIGILNSALPFYLYSVAALYLPASYSAILNSSSPLFSAVLAHLWLGDSLNPKKAFGLLLGMTGVAVVAKVGPIGLSPLVGWAIAACLAASLCYALSGVYIKKYSGGANSRAIAAASQLLGGLALAPFTFSSNVSVKVFTPFVVGNLLVLALVCSGVAYLLFYRLVADVGPTKALTVTFLVPVFGVLFGSLFLNETVTTSMLAGCALIVLGTAIVLNISVSGAASSRA